MKELMQFLETSYTAYQAVEHAELLLQDNGFLPLKENETWELVRGGKYYVERGGSALIAFTIGEGEGFRIVASHTDSPCFKLKEHPVTEENPFRRLNVEPYGGGIRYTFFDRPLRLAGRLIKEQDGALVSENYVGEFSLVLPSLAIHQQREVNEKFAPDPQTELPLLDLGGGELEKALGDPVSFDLYLVSAEKPFVSGLNGEFVTSPRVDDLSGVYASLRALIGAENRTGIAVAACLDHEEIGSRTCEGAGGDFLRRTLERIRRALHCSEEAGGSDFLLSLDNAHSMHPNHPEVCDPTNRAVLGGGIVIKGHAERAYTTDALSSAIVKTVFSRAGVRYQTFFNRSNMRSGGTLGAISTGQVSILAADIGLAQLAMHSAVETFAKSDYFELVKGLTAFYETAIALDGGRAKIG